MDKIKESITCYNEKLHMENRRSLSRMCNCTVGAFLLFMMIYGMDHISSWMILLGIIIVLLILRVLHVYLIIADTFDVKLLYFGMLVCELVFLTIGFFTIGFLYYFILIIVMLIGFPFLFHWLRNLKK